MSETGWIEFWSAVSTVGTLLLFVGVLIWVMSKKRDADFDKAANQPLEDDDQEHRLRR